MTQRIQQCSRPTCWSVVNDEVNVAVKRSLANAISSAVVVSFNVGQIYDSVFRIQSQGHTVDKISEQRAQFSGIRLQLVDVLLVVIGNHQIVDVAIVKWHYNA